ncbi:hypothetical protein HPP92_003396 [Vanilla planifolia]|uniref:Rhodanese domain-containing protein n=1 Tax=Vanilla planifolia TaxID=51239 RepID=A0A835S813_VANPL|nr:hypothetical protein HPP92_003396 [Vanilla planifolia]
METNGTRKESDSYAVLLYYTYAFIPDVASLAGFYDKHCRSLGLVGRIRIGADGVNATIGGRFSALEEHIAAMKTDSLFYGTDFKLAPCRYPTNEKIAKECGFNSLSVRAVKELVTFRSDSMLKSPKILNAGRHLSATEFHHILQEAGNSSKCGETRKKEDVILLDVRNVYETRIGMFKVENVDTLDPKIRQYSDLATWMDDHSERLRNKKVLMYCTGGIRCEMASAYIISKGADFENVFQASHLERSSFNHFNKFSS